VRQLILSPRWIFWHVLTLGAMVACGFLSAWQWHRAGSAMGSALNIGYGVQWPIFAVFFGFMWWHFLRTELRTLRESGAAGPDAAPEAGSEPAPAPAPAELPTPRPEPAPAPVDDDRPSPFGPRPAGIEPSRLSDPQIRAYNDALAELAARDQES